MADEAAPILELRPSFWGFNIVASLSTKYIITEDHLLIHTGLLTKEYNRIPLYKIIDITVHQSLFQRLYMLGNIVIISSDVTEPKLTLKAIEDAPKVADIISKHVELAKQKRRFIIEGGGDKI
jgi:uncharacterized membrane protein YdbT with pleckstrin-like domain